MTTEATGLKKATGSFKYSLGEYETEINAKVDELTKLNAVQRVWNKDAALWSGADESQWLGWLDIVKEQLDSLDTFTKLSADIKQAGFKQALLIGMGGSSLCVEVLRLTFGVESGFPDMHVLDSTVPAQVSRTRKLLDLSKTVIIVASKSGGTTEPNVLCDYFYDEVRKEVGDKVGEHFIAVTDPGSSMEQKAKDLKFRAITHGKPSIGGRFSALSNFGMVPSAVMGYDIKKFLDHAQKMVDACGPGTTVRDNPGAMLGTIMGVLAQKGRDKVTVFASPAIHSLGAWLEQLMAESTGKEGKGLIPVAGEKLLEPDEYGSDRLFVYIRLASDPDLDQDQRARNLMQSGDPVVYIELADKVDLGGEFFRWEFATAVAGAVLGINAFNQPNVQESKDYTKKYLAEYTEKGKLPEDVLLHEEDGIKLYVDASNEAYLRKTVEGNKTFDAYIAAHLGRLVPNDYYATNAYIDRDEKNEKRVDKLRTMVLERKRNATTVGFGPRFLHSTGQLHKGGPNSGVFLQVTSNDEQDLPIPGEKYSFGVLKQAQALGDFLALSKRNRRLLRVHLPADVAYGLDRLEKAIRSALA